MLLLSWFGNKLSIQYIMNLSSASYPCFWSLFFVYLCQIILMHAPYYNTHGLSHQNPVIAHKGLQGAPILEYLCITKTISLLFMFSCFSDIVCDYNEYKNAHIRRILRNSSMGNKLGIKGLRSIVDAMKPTCSRPIDSYS